ncbi:hemagglutinin domain protein [Burkholderia pseudomallei TSV5]|nr:hemagglutinin domain protein [Burkholderia pseudomallei TSV5]
MVGMTPMLMRTVQLEMAHIRTLPIPRVLGRGKISRQRRRKTSLNRTWLTMVAN